MRFYCLKFHRSFFYWCFSPNIDLMSDLRGKFSSGDDGRSAFARNGLREDNVSSELSISRCSTSSGTIFSEFDNISLDASIFGSPTSSASACLTALWWVGRDIVELG